MSIIGVSAAAKSPRANANRCFSPPLKDIPFSMTLLSKPKDSRGTTLENSARLRYFFSCREQCHGEKKTQREVADVAGVTEVTIRNRYKELLEELGLEKEVKKFKKRRR